MATQTPEHGRVIHLAIELSSSIWLVAAHLPGAEKPKLHRIEAGDTAAPMARKPVLLLPAPGRTPVQSAWARCR